jgi:hypothetical protein
MTKLPPDLGSKLSPQQNLMLEFIRRKMHTAVITAILGGVALVANPQKLLADPIMAFECDIFHQCIPDQQYHAVIPVQKDGVTKYMNESGGDYVAKRTMYSGVFGWQAKDPRAVWDKKVTSADREVEFYSAFLEINESGQLFDEKQKAAVLAKIGELQKKGPVYVVMYIHGWHHNANDDEDLSKPESVNNNTIKFNYFTTRYAEQTRRLFELNSRWFEVNKSKISPIIFGIYVGWRGESRNANQIESVTTLGYRAVIADQIGRATGSRSLKQAFIDIAAEMRKSKDDSRMLLLGHSLGGRIASVMFLGDIAKGTLQPLGEKVLIVAIEPAIGADCYDDIFKGKIKGNPGQPPSFISLTSEDDTAIQVLYTISRKIPLLGPVACNRESDSRNVTIGSQEAYQTHRYQFDYVGHKTNTGPWPSDLLDKDGKTLKSPLIDQDRNWLYEEGQTVWYYLFYQTKSQESKAWKKYDSDAEVYRLRVTHLQGYAWAGAVWVIKTDRDLIDVSENALHEKPNGLLARHNAIASTGLADILTRIVFAGKDWQVQEKIIEPEKEPVPPVVATPVPEPARPITDMAPKIDQLKP